MRRRIDAGELVAAVGGALVLVALFLDWFGPATGWQVFEALDLVLTALAATAIAVGASSIGSAGAGGGRWLLPVGLALVAIVVVQIAEPPPVAAELDAKTGAWLALAGAVLVLVGGIAHVLRIDVTVTVEPRDARARVPAVDRRPGTGDEGGPAGEDRPAEAPRGGAAAGPGRRGAAPARARRSLLDDDAAAPDARGRAARDADPVTARRRPDPDATQPLEPVDREG
jgi:hypothetical protein